MDADTDNLERVVRVLESYITNMIEMRHDLQAKLAACEMELRDLMHARHTIAGGIEALKDNREEPEQVRH